MKVQCTVESAGNDDKKQLLIASDNIATHNFVMLQIEDQAKNYMYIVVDGREAIKAIENAMNI